jgi:hypothetical protein
MRVDNDTGALNYRLHPKDANPFQSGSRCFAVYRAVKWIVGTECIACVEPTFVSSTVTPRCFPGPLFDCLCAACEHAPLIARACRQRS